MNLPHRLYSPLSVALLLALGACAGPAPLSPDKAAATTTLQAPSASMVVGPDFTSQSVRFRCAGGTEL